MAIRTRSGSPARRRTRGIIRAAVLATGVALALAGCSSGGATSGSSSEPITIGYSTYTLENPAFAGIVQGIKNESKKFGYKFVVTNSNNSASQQITDVEGMVTRGVSDIIITPADGTAISPAITAAKNANIPVFALADLIKAPVEATYSMDHEQGGELAGKAIVAALTKKYGSPKGNVVDLEGIPGLAATNEREAGFAKAIKPYPNIKVVARANGGFDTATSNTAMATILQAHSDIDALYGANDASTYGGLTAIKSAGRLKKVGDPGHIYAIGIDGSAPGINGVRDGSQDATVSQEFIKMGVLLLDNIHKKAQGTIKKVPSVVWPLKVITAENIGSADVKSYGIWADDVTK